jgi:hypothetical protein
MFRLKTQFAAAVLTAAAMTIGGTAALAVPFQVGFDHRENHDHAFAQGFSPSVRANPDPFTDPMLGLEDLVPLDRFRIFKSDYQFEDPENPGMFLPLIATDFKLAIVDNYFLDLSTFTTSSPQLIGLSTNTIATTETLTAGTPIDFAFDSLEISYGAIDYAAIFVKDDGAGNLSVVDVPLMLVTHAESPPGSGTFVPTLEYGSPTSDFIYSASNFRNGNFLTTFHPPYADVSFVAYFDLQEAEMPGDFNNDGIVDAADYTVWRNNLGDTDETNISNNGNGADGVDDADYALWKMHYGESVPMELGGGGLAGSVVPEPGTGALLLLAGCVTVLGATGRRGRIAGARRS